LFEVNHCETDEYPPPLRRQTHADTTTIFGVRFAFEQTSFGQSIDQANRTVMAQVHGFGQFANSETGRSWRSLDGEQHLILLLGVASGARGFSAKMQKAAQGMAIGGERLIISVGGAGHDESWNIKLT